MPKPDPKRRIKTAILISGRGSNMVSLIEASRQDDYPASIKLVISNRPSAAGLEKARAYGIKAICIDHTEFSSRRNFEAALQDALEAEGIELICCAGFMRVLTSSFTQRWKRRMLNIHPSLLPKYKGLNTHARAIEAGDAEHGCSVHYVSEELDGGEVLRQARIKIETGDTPESLAEKILSQELSLYPKILRIVAIGINVD